MRSLLLGFIRFYQAAISPWTGPVCRFSPTCSQYTKEAIVKFGVSKGLWLAVKRIARCHPFCHGGFDPVP